MVNRKKIFLIIFLIILVLIVLLIMLLNNNFKDKSVHDFTNVIGYTNSLDDVYFGKIPSYKIANKIQILFETYLPSISQELIGKNTEQLENYFDIDSERINMNIGIENKNEFVEFATGLQELKCDLSEFKEITYIENSYKKDNDECIELEVRYKNDNKVKCKVYLKQDTEGKVYTKFQIIK